MANKWIAVAAPQGTDPAIFFEAGLGIIPSIKPYIVQEEMNRHDWFIRINKEGFRIEGRASVDSRLGLAELPHCYKGSGAEWPCDLMTLEDFIDAYIGKNFKDDFTLEEVLALG